MLDEELEKMGYIVDSVTGFLQKNSEKNSKPEFNPKEKTAFLKRLQIHGNQSKAADEVGVSFQEVEFHIRKDLIFKEAFRATLLKMRHSLEGKLYQAGMEGKSKEALAWLASYFKEDYTPARVNKHNKEKDTSEIDRLFNAK